MAGQPRHIFVNIPVSDVAASAELFRTAGATRAGEPVDTDSQYLRSFHDLDGHLWEVIHIA